MSRAKHLHETENTFNLPQSDRDGQTESIALISLKIIIVSIACVISLNSCTKTEVATVQTETPAAIQQLVETYKQLNATGCTCHPYIKQYIWRNQNVYVTGNNDNLDIQAGYICDWIPLFYNAAGNRFEIDGSYSYDKYQEFLRTSRYIKTIWACE